MSDDTDTEDRELLRWLRWWRRRRNEIVGELSQAESCIRTLEEVIAKKAAQAEARSERR